MTGYARAVGAAGAAIWAWDIKSVNGKALDIRCRVPPGFDAIEVQTRARIAARVQRGTVQVSLALQRPPPSRVAQINEPILRTLVAAVGTIERPAGLAPASLDGLLAIPGVVEVTEIGDAAGEPNHAALLATLDEALDAFLAMRGREGEMLAEVLARRIESVRRNVSAAEAAPGRTVEAVRARIAQRVAELAGAIPALDAARLHAEAVLLAAKADVREELDRLAMHAAAVADLLDQGGAVGRRLDFLAQELGREASTLCAKSNDAALTLIGLDLRTEIDQFREQVQNLE